MSALVYRESDAAAVSLSVLAGTAASWFCCCDGPFRSPCGPIGSRRAPGSHRSPLGLSEPHLGPSGFPGPGPPRILWQPVMVPLWAPGPPGSPLDQQAAPPSSGRRLMRVAWQQGRRLMRVAWQRSRKSQEEPEMVRRRNWKDPGRPIRTQDDPGNLGKPKRPRADESGSGGLAVRHRRVNRDMSRIERLHCRLVKGVGS